MSGDYLERLTAFLNHHEAQPWSDTVLLLSDDSDVPDLDVGDLRAALDELEAARAERVGLGGAEHQLRIVTPSGPVHSFTQRDLDDRANWLPGVRLEQRTVYGTQWEPADPKQAEQ